MKNFITFSLIIISFNSFAQFFTPPMEPLFVDNEIPIVNIYLEQDSLDIMLENVDSYHEYPATFVFKHSGMNDTIENVGTRIRGNTSRYSAKKSFKVSFNTFTDGGDYFGLEKMNFNGEHNDPSVIRSKLCWDILYDFGVPATRCNHVDLYINDEYKGLYMNVEHIDEEFVESRFGNKDGNLYKCLWPSDLVYMGTNQSAYEEIYELKTNTDVNDYSNLINFIDVVNNTPLDQLAEALEEIFNINTFLKFLAVEVFTSHWDSYSYLKNNFYLYENSKTGKMEYIPYDMDNTYGIDWFGEDWANRNIYNWANEGEPRPLNTRILQIDEYRDRYSYYLNQLVLDFVPEDTFFPRIDEIKNMISPSAENDVYRSYDYGWSYDDFLTSYDYALSANHVTYGLKEYISTRLSSIENQIIINDINPIIYYTETGLPAINQNLSVKAYIEDESEDLDITLFYSYGTTSDSETMTLENDARINTYLADIIVTEGSVFSYYITAEDNLGNTSRFPRSGFLEIPIQTEEYAGLYINEIMASNSNTYADNNGDYDDWVEIYNASNNDIWLGDYYLSDNMSLPSKYKLPDQNLGSGSFLIIWADGETEQGMNHADFKLSKDGEEIVLSKYVDGIYNIVDHFVFGPQNTDISYGKLPDGNGTPEFLSPTPGYGNIILSSPLIFEEMEINIYPNPFNEFLHIKTNKEISHVSIVNLYGQLVFDKMVNSQEIRINPNLLPGIYIIMLRDNRNKTKTQKIIAN